MAWGRVRMVTRDVEGVQLGTALNALYSFKLNNDFFDCGVKILLNVMHKH